MGPKPQAREALTMRMAARILAVLILLSGTVFFFQGIGVITVSFMTGRLEWS